MHVHLMQGQMVQKQHSPGIVLRSSLMADRESDRELVRGWRRLLERYHSISSALERALNQEHQLGVSEFEILDCLVEIPRSTKPACRVQDLAASVHLSQSALSRAIARLERDGLVTRAMCPEDRRGIYVHLTDAGRERHARARPTQRAVLAVQLGRAHSTGKPRRRKKQRPVRDADVAGRAPSE